MLTHKGTKQLETERLVLRRFTENDAQDMYTNWASDREVTKFLTWPPHENIEVTQNILADWAKEYEKEDYYHWAIALKETSELIGSIGVVDGDEKIASFEMGYCTAKAHWGKGILSEALSRVIQYLFDEIGANRIYAKHDPNNPASGQVMEKCGLVYEGTLRQAAIHTDGSLYDFKLRSILRSEYEEIKAQRG